MPIASNADTQSTNFGYFAHAFGVVYGAASMMAIDDQFKSDDADEDEYAEEYVDEYADD